MSKKKILVHENKSRIQQLEKDLITATERVNEFARITAQVINRDLTDKELTEMIHSGKNFALNELKKDFPFPKAEDDFNLNAMGLIADFRQLERFERTNAKLWQQFDFTAKNGKFGPEKVQPVIEAERYYADTKEKQEVLEFAQELVEVWGKAKRLNIDPILRDFVGAFSPLIYGFKPTGEDVKIMIDERGISSVFRRMDLENRKLTIKELASDGK